jgi:hypothetical protein
MVEDIIELFEVDQAGEIEECLSRVCWANRGVGNPIHLRQIEVPHKHDLSVRSTRSHNIFKHGTKTNVYIRRHIWWYIYTAQQKGGIISQVNTDKQALKVNRFSWDQRRRQSIADGDQNPASRRLSASKGGSITSIDVMMYEAQLRIKDFGGQIGLSKRQEFVKAGGQFCSKINEFSFESIYILIIE